MSFKSNLSIIPGPCLFQEGKNMKTVLKKSSRGLVLRIDDFMRRRSL